MKKAQEAIGTALFNLANIAIGATIVGYIFERKVGIVECALVVLFAVVCYVGGYLLLRSEVTRG